MGKQPIFHRHILTALASVTVSIVMSVSSVAPPQAATIGIPHYQPSQQAGAESYQKGMAAFAKGDLIMAKQAFQEVVKRVPTHLGAILGLAEIAWKEKNHQMVKNYLKRAMKLAPKNPLVYQAWGKHLVQQGQFADAENALIKGIRLEPKQVSLHVHLGDLYLHSLREPRRAISAYQEALHLDATHAGAHYGLGMAHFALQQVGKASEALERATRLTPTNPLPFYFLGRTYIAQHAYDKALHSLGTAIRLQPKFVEAHVAIGDIHTAQHKDHEAMASYEQAKTLAPKVGGIYVKLGLLHERNQRFDEASKAFEQAITLDPNQAIAFNNLAWIATQKNLRLDEALEWAQKAVSLAPQVSAFQDTLGWVYRVRGELDKAANTLRSASILKPEIPDIHYHLGIVETELGNTKNAITAFTRALELDENFADAIDAQERLATLQSQ